MVSLTKEAFIHYTNCIDFDECLPFLAEIGLLNCRIVGTSKLPFGGFAFTH